MADRIRTGIEGGVADVRLARPEKLNAVDVAMFEALVETGRRLGREPSLRVVVLSGEGRGFCAGLDVSIFGGAAGAGDTVRLLERSDESPANLAQRAAWIWRELPVPVIAALHGVCFGAGLQIAMAADLRLAAPDARLSVREIQWGLIPDMTGSRTLPALVGSDHARELTYTGRTVSGQEAADLGLVTRLSETPRETALELAGEIAARSPDAIRAAKQLLDVGPELPLEAGLRLEERLQLGLIGGANQREAVQANLEQRAPRFSDPAGEPERPREKQR